MRALRRLLHAINRSAYSPPSASASSKRASVSASGSLSASLAAVPFVMASSHYSTSVTKPQLGPDAVPEDAASRPHHVVKNNGTISHFRNIHPSAGNLFSAWPFFRTMIAAAIAGDLKMPTPVPPTVPVHKPTFLPTRWSSPSLRATWLGHACYYVEYPSGLRVLFDPVFEHRCSPFSWLGPQRFTPRPCDIADLPFVDAVVISHSHYDHLSNPTVHEIARRFPDAHFFVGLGLAEWFRSAGIHKVTELDWWETADLTMAAAREGKGGGGDNDAEVADTTTGSASSSITARIGCLPAQHSSARGITDRDTTLWCSWSVVSGASSVWFGGDTGYRAVPKIAAPAPGAEAEAEDPAAADWEPPYDGLPVCPQFEQIGRLRGPFDLGLIPIGAYGPRHVFSHMHANPYDAVEIFRDTRCKRAMGIHWGTWILTAEDVLEPPRLLKRALKRRGIQDEGVFDVCDIGESREF